MFPMVLSMALLALLSLSIFVGIASAQFGSKLQDPAMNELTDMCITKDLPTEACGSGRIELDPKIPHGYIQDHAFERSFITAVSIPNTVYSIGSAAFFSTRYLTYVTIPPSVENIGNSAFKAASLTTVDFSIAENLQFIDDRAFQHNKLKKIEIPPKVISIGKYAFNNNPLVSICYKGDKPPRLDEDALPDDITLVPCKRKNEL